MASSSLTVTITGSNNDYSYAYDPIEDTVCKGGKVTFVNNTEDDLDIQAVDQIEPFTKVWPVIKAGKTKKRDVSEQAADGTYKFIATKTGGDDDCGGGDPTDSGEIIVED